LSQYTKIYRNNRLKTCWCLVTFSQSSTKILFKTSGILSLISGRVRYSVCYWGVSSSILVFPDLLDIVIPRSLDSFSRGSVPRYTLFPIRNCSFLLWSRGRNRICKFPQFLLLSVILVGRRQHSIFRNPFVPPNLLSLCYHQVLATFFSSLCSGLCSVGRRLAFPFQFDSQLRGSGWLEILILY
jgi:hypothetical protein